MAKGTDDALSKGVLKEVKKAQNDRGQELPGLAQEVANDFDDSPVEQGGQRSGREGEITADDVEALINQHEQTTSGDVDPSPNQQARIRDMDASELQKLKKQQKDILDKLGIVVDFLERYQPAFEALESFAKKRRTKSQKKNFEQQKNRNRDNGKSRENGSGSSSSLDDIKEKLNNL